VYQYIKLDETTNQPDGMTCVDCPRNGVVCDGVTTTYRGGVWHSLNIVNPTVDTSVYVCVTEGCPDEGATEMRCKSGYGGPLCAVCQAGYFKHIRECRECREPQIGLFVLFVCIGALVIYGALRLERKYHAFLSRGTAFSHFKLLVSFATVLVTVDKQFG
jgi:hypothetical protein